MTTPTRQRLVWEATKAAKSGRIDAAALDVVRRLAREPPSPASDAKVEAFAAAFLAKLGGGDAGGGGGSAAAAAAPPAAGSNAASQGAKLQLGAATTTATTTAATTASLTRLPRDALVMVMAYLAPSERRALAGASLALCTAVWPASEWRREVAEGMDERTRRVLADAALFPDVADDASRHVVVAVAARGLWLSRFVHRRAAATMLRARWLRAHLLELNVELHAVSAVGPQPKHVIRQTLAPRFSEHDDPDAVAVVSRLTMGGARGNDDDVEDGDDDDDDDGLERGAFRDVANHDVLVNDGERLEGDTVSDDEDGAPKVWYLRLPFAARDVGTVVCPTTTLELRARRNLSPEIGLVGTLTPTMRMHRRGHMSLTPGRGSPTSVQGTMRVTMMGRKGCMLLGRVLHNDEEHFRTEAFAHGQGNHGQANWGAQNLQEIVSHHASRYRAPNGYYEVAQETPLLVFVPVNALFHHCCPPPS